MSLRDEPEPALPAAVVQVDVRRHARAGGAPSGHAAGGSEPDAVAEEVPVAFEYNGVSHAVMLASPLDLEDFAVGFSLTEGIIERPDQIYDVETVVDPQGLRLRIDLAGECFAALKARRRTLAGRTGCGLCGAENLAQAMRPLPSLAADDFALPAAVLHAAFDALRERQPLQQATGATHAAGWVDASGRLTLVREDVGRHNALDKVLGALARGGSGSGGARGGTRGGTRDGTGTRGAAIVTSRASVEMVQKAAMLGVPILATISGPTALAIRTAQECGLTLAAYFRDRGHVRYAHGGRLD
ncbi:MAG: formate dehydrogenase accessory sulfurtransferase FdhD [Burkholderiaceae bacterium]